MVKDLFSIPVAIIDLHDKVNNLRQINNDLIKSFIESLIDDGYKNSSGILEVYQSNKFLENKKPAINEFLNLISPVVSEFLKEIRFSDSFLNNFKLSGVWGNLTTGMGAHTSHVHGKGAHQPFSLVYFPCCFVNPENIDNIIFKESTNIEDIGSLLLYSPGWELKEIAFNQKDSFQKNIYNQLIFPINPSEGLLVIFPSFISHMVTPSRGATKNNARVSFSLFAEIK